MKPLLNKERRTTLDDDSMLKRAQRAQSGRAFLKSNTVSRHRLIDGLRNTVQREFLKFFFFRVALRFEVVGIKGGCCGRIERNSSDRF